MYIFTYHINKFVCTQLFICIYRFAFIHIYMYTLMALTLEHVIFCRAISLLQIGKKEEHMLHVTKTMQRCSSSSIICVMASILLHVIFCKAIFADTNSCFVFSCFLVSRSHDGASSTLQRSICHRGASFLGQLATCFYILSACREA